MNREIRKMWLRALRSGKYQQSAGALSGVYFTGPAPTSSIAYCCLGVLAHVTGHLNADGVCLTATGKNTGADTLLADSVRTLFGITRRQHLDLAHLNDVEGYDFNQIADYIKENL